MESPRITTSELLEAIAQLDGVELVKVARHIAKL